jgi:hypothetical protein
MRWQALIRVCAPNPVAKRAEPRHSKPQRHDTVSRRGAQGVTVQRNETDKVIKSSWHGVQCDLKSSLDVMWRWRLKSWAGDWF